MNRMLVVQLSMISMMATLSMANAAEISATYAKRKQVKIALDSKSIPRVDKNSKSNPTIKDFAKGTEYTDVCYSGEQLEMEKLLKALVKAANGDGDSYARLKSIKTDKESLITVKATIEDESGNSDVSYKFSPCEMPVVTRNFSCDELESGKDDHVSITIGFTKVKSPEVLSASWLERNRDSVQPLFFSMPDLNVVPHSKVGAKQIKYSIPSDGGDRLNLTIVSSEKDLAKKSEFIIKASTENGHGSPYLMEHEFKCEKQ